MKTMAKKFWEYCDEYNDEIYKSLQDHPENNFIVDRSIWILSKWEVENNLNPWEENYRTALQQVKKSDRDLYDELILGYTTKLQAIQAMQDGKK